MREFHSLAKSIIKNSKGEVLLQALRSGFAAAEEAQKRGNAPMLQKKAIIFTESRRTQEYLCQILEKLTEKNTRCFEEELDKLDRWGEGQRNSLKAALRELEDQIKETRKAARMAPNLPEKLKLEREKRSMETKRDEAWKQYEQAAKDVETRKDNLMDEVEKRFEQQVSEQMLFTIKWKVS